MDKTYDFRLDSVSRPPEPAAIAREDLRDIWDLIDETVKAELKDPVKEKAAFDRMVPVMIRYAFLTEGCVATVAAGTVRYAGQNLNLDQDLLGELGDLVKIICFYDRYHGGCMIIDEESVFSMHARI